jgi:hypothetical protein
MSVKKREKLFLGTLEEFRFDFAQDLPAEGAIAGDDDEGLDDARVTSLDGSSSRANAPAALTIEDVASLVQPARSAGSAFFALPANVASIDEAVEQFRQQVMQLTRRDVADPRAKAHGRGHRTDGAEGTPTAKRRE